MKNIRTKILKLAINNVTFRQIIRIGFQPDVYEKDNYVSMFD